MAAEAPQEQPGNAADEPEEQSLLARLAELLKLTDPSPDQVAAITILVGELVGEPEHPERFATTGAQSVPRIRP